MKSLFFTWASVLFLLMCFLVLGPEFVSAQNYTPGNPVCSSNPDGAFGEPVASCPSGGVSDTVPYVLPCANQNQSSTTCSVDSSVYVQGMQGQTARNVVYQQGSYVIQSSNEKHLVYQIRGGDIYFVQDTTWANSSMCAEGGRAFQRIYSDSGHSNLGAKHLDRAMSCGGVTRSTMFNKAYSYSGDEEGLRANPAGGANVCSNPNEGNVSGARQLIFHGNAMCGSYSGPMISIYNSEGAGKGEVFMYCQGKGLCGWYQNINFSDPENQPANWAGKDLCAGFGLQAKACPVMCSKEKLNEVKTFSIASAVETLLGGGSSYVQQLNPLEPNSPDKTHDATDMDYKLKPVAEALMPNQIKLREPAYQNYNAPAENGKVIVKGAGNPLIIDTKSTVYVNGQGVEAGSINGSDALMNATDDTALNKNNFYLNALGSATGRNTIDEKNVPGGHDVSLPSEVLVEQLVACDPDTPSGVRQTSNPADGKNVYTGGTGGGSGNIVINFVGQVVENILLLISGGEQDKARALAETLGLTVRLCSCTNISGINKITENVNEHNNSILPKQLIDTKVLTEVENAEVENPYKCPLGGDCTIKNTQENMNRNQKSTDAVVCSSLPFGSPQYAQKCGDGSTAPSSLATLPNTVTPGSSTNNSSLDYEIDYKNTSCTLNQSIIDSAKQEISRIWPEFALIGNQNLQNQWQNLQSTAQSLGVNPAFAIALWIEESAAGGATYATGMGCAPGILPTGGSPEVTLRQLRCMAGVVNETQSFLGFMCRYSGEPNWRTGSCQSPFTNNPNFPGGIERWYGNLSSNLSNECRIQQR